MKKITLTFTLLAFVLLISATLDLGNLFEYAAQTKPNYINKDNTPANNAINNTMATVGRVLFYDKQLSLNNATACASCHMQAFAFGDTAVFSRGFTGGLTGRHSMRLINARFGTEARFFWDERAATLEAQTTQPIQDHIEMGFSNSNGQPGFDSLLNKLNALPYYKQLLKFAFNKDTVFNEVMMQRALAQFVRSIQSFDSKFDIGLAQSGNLGAPFANFTAEENTGKQLFLNPPPQGGAGCQGCHRAPEFDIDPNTLNNGIIGGANGPDLNNTRSPSLRDVFNRNGTLNGPLMHNGVFTTMLQAINHYNAIPNAPVNTNLDPRLRPGGQPQRLNLTLAQREAIEAFLKTLSGSDVYTNPKWSNPFDSNGNITVIVPQTTGIITLDKPVYTVYPNPFSNAIAVSYTTNQPINVRMYKLNGALVLQETVSSEQAILTQQLMPGIYIMHISNNSGKLVQTLKIVKTE